MGDSAHADEDGAGDVEGIRSRLGAGSLVRPRRVFKLFIFI